LIKQNTNDANTHLEQRFQPKLLVETEDNQLPIVGEKVSKKLLLVKLLISFEVALIRSYQQLKHVEK
jgi:hypothetical protein